MRTTLRTRAGWIGLAVSACTLVGGAALAATTTDRPGSILIFPKVVTTGTRDTVIQVTNTGNMPGDVRCFYLDGQTCLETDFDLSLTRQQPTVWDAEAGRRVDPRDSEAGLDPGLVPPLPANYQGALVCVEVDTSDMPMIRNQLKGEATITDRSGTFSQNSVSKYNAVAVQGITSSGDPNTLTLDNKEYSACPASLVVDFNRTGQDGVVQGLGNGGRCIGGVNPGAGCNNNTQCPGNPGIPIPAGTCSNAAGTSNALTRVTVVPCNLDFSTVTRTNVTLELLRSDETEVTLSGGIPQFACWASFLIDDAFKPVGTPGNNPCTTPYCTAGIRSTAGGPVVGVAETFVSDSLANTASAAVDLHTRGVCSLNAGNSYCNRDQDCPAGFGTCVFTQPSVIQVPAH